MPFEQRVAGAEFGENLVFGHVGECGLSMRSPAAGRLARPGPPASLSKILPRSA